MEEKNVSSLSASNLSDSLLVENRNKIRRKRGALCKEGKILMPTSDEPCYLRVLRDLNSGLNTAQLVPIRFITDLHGAIPVLDDGLNQVWTV
jgi:hypothetical protein